MDAWSLNPERPHTGARKLGDVPLAYPDTSAEDHPVWRERGAGHYPSFNHTLSPALQLSKMTEILSQGTRELLGAVLSNFSPCYRQSRLDFRLTVAFVFGLKRIWAAFNHQNSLPICWIRGFPKQLCLNRSQLLVFRCVQQKCFA